MHKETIMFFKRTRSFIKLGTNKADRALAYLHKDQLTKAHFEETQDDEQLLINAHGYQEDFLSAKLEADIIRDKNPLLVEVLAKLHSKVKDK